MIKLYKTDVCLKTQHFFHHLVLPGYQKDQLLGRELTVFVVQRKGAIRHQEAWPSNMFDVLICRLWVFFQPEFWKLLASLGSLKTIEKPFAPVDPMLSLSPSVLNHRGQRPPKALAPAGVGEIHAAASCAVKDKTQSCKGSPATNSDDLSWTCSWLGRWKKIYWFRSL